MTVSDLAAEIYARVITDRILGNPKVWEVPEKQARGIAQAAYDAAEVFVSAGLSCAPAFKPPVSNPLGPPPDE